MVMVELINTSSVFLAIMLLVLLQKNVTALQIVHGQGRKSHFNSTFQPPRYQPLELKSLGLAGNSDYKLRHNVKYDFWFFTNPRFNGPHTDSMLNSEGIHTSIGMHRSYCYPLTPPYDLIVKVYTLH